jgi:hypothetical protein
MISYEEYVKVVNKFGGSRPFDIKGNNYFVVFEHSIQLYNFYTVNDKCQAPERLYLSLEVAQKVITYLNSELMVKN